METPKKVLVIGSGAIKIAEAAEFDYSGSQALKALKEEGVETILVNPNVATIQTSYEFADKVYLSPLKLEFLEKIIELENPDSILLGFGGQAALSLGIQLHYRGILERYGVKVLGTPINGIERALNRELFRKTMIEYGLPIPPSAAAKTPEEATDLANKIGFPVIVRVSFNLGGSGAFIAYNEKEFSKRILRAFAQSEISLVLIEKYLGGWKEIEFEVVRDRKGNAVATACLENVDPMGVHTGVSIVVAPSQTLTNKEYYELRKASIGVADSIGLIGECNVQLALNSNSEEYYVIETNPRMSRSSALASKATGYPLAYIAAKLALGYTLDELLNKVTGVTCACFEPSLDYVVVKVPRWDFAKFENVDTSLGPEMKSIGEVMAIGRNLEEAFQKAIRMLDIGEPGLTAGTYYEKPEPIHSILEKIRKRKPYWPLHVAKAIRLGISIDDIFKMTGIDKFFLNVIKNVVELTEELRGRNLKDMETLPLLLEAKELGFSNEQIAKLLNTTPEIIRKYLKNHSINPYVKRIDTLAAEWPAQTNYLYVTYAASKNDVPKAAGKKPKLLVIGAGVFRIGVSVEFDWATVNFAKAANRRGYEVIILNYNPETVSTDWDMSDKLYFEEITFERVLDIYEHEKVKGVVIFVGGQLANNLAKKLEDSGMYLVGTSGHIVDIAENRACFSTLLDKLGLKQPEWIEAKSLKEVIKFAESIGYPVIVRPSYVLSGTAMKVAYSNSELVNFLETATEISSEYPVVVSKFIEGAIEAEIDAVADGRRVVGVPIEHVEEAGVHSGDATMVTPPKRLSPIAVKKMKDAVAKIALELGIKGPFNVQFLVKNGEVYVIELNLRASRSMPFVSKSRGVNLMELAAQAVLDGMLKMGEEGEFYEPPANVWAVKTPQFSWTRLRGAYPFLGPEMRSTGEVAIIGKTYESALLASWLAAQPNKIPLMNTAILMYTAIPRDKSVFEKAVMNFKDLNYNILTLDRAAIESPVVKYINKEDAVKMLKSRRIGLVATSGYTPEIDYEIRRWTVDLNIPLVLDAHLALELSKAIKIKSKNLKQLINETCILLPYRSVTPKTKIYASNPHSGKTANN